MDALPMDPWSWATQQFGDCELGDQRRTKRVVKMAAKVAENPSASFPEQFGNWADLKAAYRFFDTDDVTFENVLAPHWKQTRAVEPNRYLVISDTTEIDFGIERDIKDLSQTGNGGGYGFLLHSALVVQAGSETLVGLAAQKIHYRQAAPQHENTTQRLARDRESQVWGEVIDLVGPASEGVQWVHVLDRGGDNFEVFCHFHEQKTDWVVRASQLHRSILTPSNKKTPLKQYLRTLAVAGSYELELRARNGRPARTAKLEIRFGALSMPEPPHKSAYVRRVHPGPIPMWVVWVREIAAPSGVEPVEWVLYTSLPVHDFAEACVVIGYYEQRWLIEEWHKALKSGCRIQERQLKEAKRLEPMVGVMSVVAVRLLQLKSIARSDPDRPAREVVPQLWIEMLWAARQMHGRKREMTVREFYRGLARLGGFIGRKSDGEPGWITIWRGWEKLHTMIQGYHIATELPQAKRQKCG